MRHVPAASESVSPARHGAKTRVVPVDLSVSGIFGVLMREEGPRYPKLDVIIPKLSRAAVLLSFLAGACSRHEPTSSPVPPETSAGATAEPAPPASATAAPATGNAAPATGNAASTASKAAAAPEEVGSDAGDDLGAAALTLYRVAACGTSGEIPAPLDARLVARHCATLQKIYERYRAGWVAVAKPFIERLRPKDLPKKVVYPFGGGDLVTALSVYPDAEEITTLSLESAGDVRYIDTILPVRLVGALAVNARNIRKLLSISYSNTINLGKGTRAWLPGEIVLMLTAMVVHGYEPTSLRYFRIMPDGSLHYLSTDEVNAEGTRTPVAPEGAGARFADVEIRFRKIGSSGPEKVVRHIAQDLSNEEVGKTPGLRAHLEAKGPVAVMTKAASHLLWAEEFSIVRDYLLDHAVWMISDSTGIPPRFARAAGFVQDTYGVFAGPARYGPIEALDGRDFRRLFAENPPRALPFQFGYPDVHRRSHLVVMRKPSPVASLAHPAAAPSGP